MKIQIYKFTIFLFFLIFFNTEAYSKKLDVFSNNSKISNYFLGIIAAQKNDIEGAIYHFKKAQPINHKNFHIKITQIFIELEKFNESILYLKKLDKKEIEFEESSILLGIDALNKKKYSMAKRYFRHLNIPSEHNFYTKNFLGNILISWVNVAEKNKKKAIYNLDKIPQAFSDIKKFQKILVKCAFDNTSVKKDFIEEIKMEESSFSRYFFFTTNYLVHKEDTQDADKIITKGIDKYSNNLLLRHTSRLVKNERFQEIKNFFDCQNINHSISEFFYLMSNIASSEKEYDLSNFYIKLSIFLNKNFIQNRSLLAENYFFQERYLESKKNYNILKRLGSPYLWHGNKRIALIKSKLQSNEKAVSFLKKEFDKIKEKNFKHYYDLANFYKDSKNYMQAIEYYSLALKDLSKRNKLYPEILYRRGSSYERLKIYDKFEDDLTNSLTISPDQAYVLNYLAYSWLERNINLERSFKMLKKANTLEKNDPYITDSLGWAHYKMGNYIMAERLVRKVVATMPTDSVVADHYGDILWKLKKETQARYLWNQALKMENIEKEFKDKVEKKLIYGLVEKL